VTRELSQTQRLGDVELAQVRQAYAALVSQVDYQLGELFGMLNDTKLLENTLIIFTSDHGDMLGDHWMGGKCVPFEASARVPMIVRLPHAMRAHQTPGRGQVSNALVCLADILPTCLSAAHIPKADGIDGIDLFRSWRGEEQRDTLFGTCGFMHYIRENQWKYCRETLGGSELLFDLAADPLEQHDLVRSGTQTEILTALRAKMEMHLDQHDLRQAANTDPAVAKNLFNLPENTCPGFTCESGRRHRGC
jgi:arylsulfatase A-like enzyme